MGADRGAVAVYRKGSGCGCGDAVHRVGTGACAPPAPSSSPPPHLWLQLRIERIELVRHDLARDCVRWYVVGPRHVLHHRLLHTAHRDHTRGRRSARHRSAGLGGGRGGRGCAAGGRLVDIFRHDAPARSRPHHGVE
eukprot:scaffold2974_cov119-Isochrysis_galbana.AAC.1